jgi:hypothetical protein
MKEFPRANRFHNVHHNYWTAALQPATMRSLLQLPGNYDESINVLKVGKSPENEA